MKGAIKILSLLVLVGITATLLAGCHNDRHVDYYDYYVTIVNDTYWTIYVEPFGYYMDPGDIVQFDVGYDIVHVIVIRHPDGLVLAELDMPAGSEFVVH